MVSEKRTVYGDLATQLAALIAGEPDLIANTANMAALIYDGLPELNWAGFYFAREGELVLGPFQGKPACVRIAWGKGVCGAAALSGTAIVVPLVSGDRVVAVLDLDSPRLGRFDDEDRAGCERLAAILVAHHRDWPAALAGEPRRSRSAAAAG